MNALVPANENFPVITGEIDNDTAALIGELRVGKIVIERGWARFYLIWKGKLFLDSTYTSYACETCGTEAQDSNIPCVRCGGVVVAEAKHKFPTLESYVEFVAEETGKSRQTIFNRLGTYRRLCDEHDVNPIDVFAMHMVSSGAARKLAAAEEEPRLINGSWQETVATALNYESKAEMLKFINHDVLNEPQYYSELHSGKVKVYRETYPDDTAVIEDFTLELTGDWPDYMIEWVARRLSIKL